MQPTLERLPVGAKATILRVEGDDPIAMRLMEMGLIDGTPIRVLGEAPFGDPREYLVSGARISLRATEARRIAVEQA
jgi:ferrous iron transport protein A